MSYARNYQVFPKLSSKKIVILSVVSLALFILTWLILSELKIVPKIILPSPIIVLNKFIGVIKSGYADKSLYEHLGISLFRVFASLFIAIIFAIPLGIFVAVNDYVRGILDPFIEFYRPLPPLAYLPLIIIWFGIGEMSKIILITLAIFAPIFLNTRAGVLSIPQERIRAALCLGASKWQLITSVIFPSSLYHIFTGIRIGIGFGWTTLVAAEMVAANSGLGHMVLTASEFLVTEVVLIGIFIIGIIAILTDLFMRYLTKKFIHWHR
ncbi:ABC transporter permease subunit [Bacteriovoracaceae bacterium]|nr:ABC transporter permease subunit [Bacteriovoracaceae bacterium]